MTGDIAVFANACLVHNLSTTVYKTRDFDPNNPVYKVKTWDKDGNVTERMVDVSKVSPTNCDTTEMYAYAAYLKDSGSWSFSTKMNWVDIVKGIMQQQYNFGNLKGYLEWKTFLELLEK